jgi:GrpB-like predicted nucleotidyltransferase (UPF0157 family)
MDERHHRSEAVRHLTAGPVEVALAEPDPRWAQMFDREAAALQHALGDDLVAVEHVGSTAVAGLPAKPVIDILVGVTRPDAVATIDERLKPVGYRFTPGSTAPARIFRRGREGSSSPWTHHLHVTAVGSSHWRRLTAFRDHLRAHPQVAHAYAQLKRELAAEHANDPGAYTAGKHGFVKAVERDAGAEHPPCAFCTTERRRP